MNCQINIPLLCVGFWSIGQLCCYVVEKHHNSDSNHIETNPQCGDKQSLPHKIEQIVLIVLAATSLLLLLLTTKITKNDHRNNITELEAENQSIHKRRHNPKSKCGFKRTLIMILGIISFLCIVADLFYIEWYFKIIQCEKYPISSQSTTTTTNNNWKWPTAQVVSQLYYYIFVILYFMVAYSEIDSVKLKNNINNYPVLVVVIIIISSMFMHWWMLTWDTNRFDENPCYSFGLMYTGNASVIINGLLFLSLTYQRNRIVTGKVRWYRYVKVITTKSKQISELEYNNAMTNTNTQMFSVNSSHARQLMVAQQPTNDFANTQSTSDTSSISCKTIATPLDSHNVASEHESGGTVPHVNVNNHCSQQRRNNVNINTRTSANNVNNNDSKYLRLLSSTQIHQAHQRQGQNKFRPPSINTSTIRTGDSLLLEQANDNSNPFIIFFQQFNSNLNENVCATEVPTTRIRSRISINNNIVGRPVSEERINMSHDIGDSTYNCNSSSAGISTSHEDYDEYNCDEEKKLNDRDDGTKENAAKNDNIDSSEHVETKIIKVECGLPLPCNEALQVWMIIFTWCSFSLFVIGYLLTLWNFDWFIAKDIRCLSWGISNNPTWIIGYFTSYHLKNLLILALIYVSLTVTMVKVCKSYFFTKRESGKEKELSFKINFLFGLLHFKYSRIWLLCYGFIISISEIFVILTISDLINNFKMPFWSKMFFTNLIEINIFTLCLVIVMGIIQFDLLANKYVLKLYHMCGQLIIALIIICVVLLVAIELVYEILSDVAWIAFYIIFYDLWYIAADILNCDGMDVTSTRIYVLGFNFAVASIILLVGFIYYAINRGDTCAIDGHRCNIYLIPVFIYLISFFIMIVMATIRYNQVWYRMAGREQCYYLSKNSFNLLCIELWRKCINHDKIGAVDVNTRRRLDGMFYVCCTCNYTSQLRGGEFARHEDDTEKPIWGNHAVWVRFFSLLLIVMSGILIFYRNFMIIFFWRCFLLVMDVNSNKEKLESKPNNTSINIVGNSN